MLIKTVHQVFPETHRKRNEELIESYSDQNRPRFSLTPKPKLMITPCSLKDHKNSPKVFQELSTICDTVNKNHETREELAILPAYMCPEIVVMRTALAKICTVPHRVVEVS